MSIIASNSSFLQWLRGSTRRTIGLYVALAVCILNITVSSDRITQAVPVASHFVQFLNKHKHFLAPGLNLVVIVILLLLLSGPLHFKSAYHDAANSVVRFKLKWIVVWILWGLIYLVEVVAAIVDSAAPDIAKASHYQIIAALVRNLINNLQTLAIVSSYLALLLPLRSASEVGYPDRPARAIFVWPLGLVLIAFLLAAQSLCEGLNLIDPTTSRPVFSLIAFMLGALALALFVSRLESRYIGTPIWATGCLYFYCLIQPVYALAESTSLVYLPVLIMAVALPLKLLLFGVVFWLLKTNRLQFYFEMTRAADLDMPSKWERFCNA